MCRWGCQTVDTTYMCAWCGTRYCAECLRGDFLGIMKSPDTCRKCCQKKCQGQRVEFNSQKPADKGDNRPKTSQKSKPPGKKKSNRQKKRGKKRRK